MIDSMKFPTVVFSEVRARVHSSEQNLHLTVSQLLDYTSEVFFCSGGRHPPQHIVCSKLENNMSGFTLENPVDAREASSGRVTGNASIQNFNMNPHFAKCNF